MRLLRTAFAMAHDFVMLPRTCGACGLARRNAKYPCGALRVEIKQLRARRSSTENAARRHDVAARVVVLRRDGVAGVHSTPPSMKACNNCVARRPRVLSERDYSSRHGIV
jgi:hypothetical protein